MFRFFQISRISEPREEKTYINKESERIANTEYGNVIRSYIRIIDSWIDEIPGRMKILCMATIEEKIRKKENAVSADLCILRIGGLIMQHVHPFPCF